MFEDKNNPKEIENLGEFGLINHLTSQIKLKNPTSVKGVGDDAAVIAPSKNKQIVVLLIC